MIPVKPLITLVIKQIFYITHFVLDWSEGVVQKSANFGKVRETAGPDVIVGILHATHHGRQQHATVGWDQVTCKHNTRYLTTSNYQTDTFD